MKSTIMKVTINFMNLNYENFFEIEFYQRTHLNHNGAIPVMTDDAKSKTLSEFVCECLERIAI